MRNRKLKKLLKLWQDNDLITQSQSENILEFMKERQKEIFFRFIKWIIIIGTFWLVFGVIATLINLYEIDFFQKLFTKIGDILIHIISFIYNWIIIPLNNNIISPLCDFIKNIFGENRRFFYLGTYSLLISALFMYINLRIKPNKDIDNLNLSDEQKNVLKMNWSLDTAFSIFFAGTFCFYNMLLLPDGVMISNDKILPIWNILGAISFMTLAYKFNKNIYLIFGIYFIALSVGMFSGYDCACYWIGVSRPIVQMLAGIILLLVAYITTLKIEIKDMKNDDNTYIAEKFADTYNWTGLLLLFIALWITSIWGFDFDLSYSHETVLELWLANILFIGTSIGSMYYGAKSEQKIFFNYGLVFFIIETYTIFCARLWNALPVGIASLILGGLLIGTGKVLTKIYLKKNIKKE